MNPLHVIGVVGVALLAGSALRAFVQCRRTPDVLGTQMSDEWMRHITQLLSKPGAGQGVYVEREQ